jgi:hypothetical protein
MEGLTGPGGEDCHTDIFTDSAQPGTGRNTRIATRIRAIETAGTYLDPLAGSGWPRRCSACWAAA